jgi:hypothetical protein
MRAEGKGTQPARVRALNNGNHQCVFALADARALGPLPAR